MYKLYLMRHGKTVYNTLRIVQGTCNSNLTRKGKQKARLARQIVSKLDFKFVVTGKLQRQIDTASIVTDKFKDKIHIENANFNEVHFGSFENKPIIHMFKKICKSNNVKSWSSIDSRIMADEIYKVDKAHDAETSESVENRIHDGIKDVIKLLDDNHETNALIVSSGLFLEILLAILVPDCGINKINNCVIYELDIEDGKYSVKEIKQ